jgi:hypothetical protein
MMLTGIKGNLFNVAAIVSISAVVAIITCTALVTNAYQARFDAPRRLEQALNVTGSARKRIHSDLAIWQIHTDSEAPDLKSSYAKLLDTTTKISKFLASKQFTESEISLNAIESQKQMAKDRHGDLTGEITSYRLKRSFTITSSNVKNVSKASAEVTELLQDGVVLISTAPQFYYTKIGDLKIEMIGEASKDARARADQIVTHAGCEIIEVRNARMGVLQITQPESTEVSSEGIYNTETIDKDVTSVVSLSFGLGKR